MINVKFVLLIAIVKVMLVFDDISSFIKLINKLFCIQQLVSGHNVFSSRAEEDQGN